MSNISIPSAFQNRHIGTSDDQLSHMLKYIGVSSLDQLVDETIPASIRLQGDLDIPDALSEADYLEMLKKIALKNKVCKSFIGYGYHGTVTPSVILRNVFSNPGWYTQYTPYQAEIAQGRLEALLNYQTMISDLTGLPIANASLLDEATAAAEAMAMFFSVKNKKVKEAAKNRFLVADTVLPQTIDVLLTRAQPLDIIVEIVSMDNVQPADDVFGILLQYPDKNGQVISFKSLTETMKAHDIAVTVAADIMSLVILEAPGEWGADAVVGNSQRFGVPMGFGGPHAAFFATKEDYKRLIPGRIIGMSVDSQGKPALRMALQTREQHIRREKATSNICTAQALLAIMASMYAVYHGPEGLKYIAEDIHQKAIHLAYGIQRAGFEVVHQQFFDTVLVKVSPVDADSFKAHSEALNYNFGYDGEYIRLAVDETHSQADIDAVIGLFNHVGKGQPVADLRFGISSELHRQSEILTHPIFSMHHTETKMMRYIKRLENKDLSLVHSMIALGSCTMKLNAATQLIPVSWENFSSIHPFAPVEQTAGYRQIFEELSDALCKITGFTACSLQPNSGAQGEYAGLLTIRAYHLDRGDTQRVVNLIPSSAHGTNPASAVMVGMDVVVVKCDEQGNIDIDDLRSKAEQYKDTLSALMVTYPSTHGVFEEGIREICEIIHQNGGLVYMDGANMNAQVGLTSPGLIGADVCHLNLHKTFAIPHGGGGPGMGPICVNDKLAPYLPGHTVVTTGGSKAVNAVSAAPWGSASILLISYAYIKMLGKIGVADATRYAILNANYMKARLEKSYKILYTGKNGRAAHEMIIDLNPFKAIGVQAEDVAKRLIDYGFHSPTLSFPVAGTLMIEPTESEDMAELDRFCDAMIQIREEIDEIARGEFPEKENVLHNAPHTAELLTSDEWNLPYSREKAAYPLPYLRMGHKFWPSVGRVDNAYGDRNLVCTCPPIESYMQA